MRRYYDDIKTIMTSASGCRLHGSRQRIHGDAAGEAGGEDAGNMHRLTLGPVLDLVPA